MGPSVDKTHLIRSVLKSRVEKRRTITYGELGARIGRGPRGPWYELDAICEQDESAGKPDITLCVVLADTNMPAKYLGRPLDLKDTDRVEQYFRDLERLFDFHDPING